MTLLLLGLTAPQLVGAFTMAPVPPRASPRACATDCDWRADAAEHMTARTWSIADRAISAAVSGEAALPGDDPPRPAPSAPGAPMHDTQATRLTWRLAVAYNGPLFSGFAWQRDAALPTVEGCLQSAIGTLVDGTSELRLSCAGRTDAGVSALGQLVSFYAAPGLDAAALARAVSDASPADGALRLVSSRSVPSSYHATYSTDWRRYAYLLPPRADQPRDEIIAEAARIDAQLKPLVGASRDFAALGRSVPDGKNTTMLMRHAAASVVDVPGSADAVVRIDLVGDRFLRQQVRVLVATAVAVADGKVDEQLLRVCTSGRPELTAHPAPAVGLVLAAAGGMDELDPSWLCEGESLEDFEPDEYTQTIGIGGGSAPAAGGSAPAAGGSAAAAAAAGGKRLQRGGPPSSAAAISAALSLLEQHAASGAAVDVLLSRHVRSNGLRQDERVAIASHLDDVVRHHGRLEWRLDAAGVDMTPRSRLMASIKLCRGGRAEAELRLVEPTRDETAWLAALQPPLETADMDQAARLECPTWAWPSVRSTFGASAVDDEMRALQQAAPLDLRVNTLRGTRKEALRSIRAAGFTAEPTPYSPIGIRLAERAVALGTVPGLLDGLVEPQDEGSQLLALLLGAQPEELVVDYCAGSGGKTLALAAQMGNKGKLLAMDVDEGRLGRSARRLVKAGVDNVERHVIEPGADKWLKRRKRSYDRVLVDAPCSGIGAWRRNPDARWVRNTRPLEGLLPIQAEVLQKAARLVRPGGVLVYATCSVLHEENDAQVEAFLASEDGADFLLAPPEGFHAPLDGKGYLRLTPARHGCDGFFGAVLTRKEGGWSRARTRRRRR